MASIGSGFGLCSQLLFGLAAFYRLRQLGADTKIQQPPGEQPDVVCAGNIRHPLSHAAFGCISQRDLQ